MPPASLMNERTIHAGPPFLLPSVRASGCQPLRSLPPSLVVSLIDRAANRQMETGRKEGRCPDTAGWVVLLLFPFFDTRSLSLFFLSLSPSLFLPPLSVAKIHTIIHGCAHFTAKPRTCKDAFMYLFTQPPFDPFCSSVRTCILQLTCSFINSFIHPFIRILRRTLTDSLCLWSTKNSVR